MTRLRLLTFTASVAAILLAGCHVNSNKNGKNDNVDIGTPFGSMQVKTNDNVDSASTGLTSYPGATAVKDDGDNDAADVNLSFGKFHLGVKALSYQTGDATDKVMAFYRKDLARYGDVIECRNNEPVGTPTHTSQGLACDSGHGHTHFDTHDDAQLELRAGSGSHMHIVAIDPKNGGTHIGLVMLDLPTNLGDDHDDKQSE